VEPQTALAAADQIITKLGPDAPAGKLAWAQVTRMHALSWGLQFNEAIDLGRSIADQYLRSPDPVAAHAGADALCHAYAYTAEYLGGAAGAQEYLDISRTAYPDGRYDWLVKIFTDLVEKFQASQQAHEAQ
jgi:hypothetical protein